MTVVAAGTVLWLTISATSSEFLPPLEVAGVGLFWTLVAVLWSASRRVQGFMVSAPIVVCTAAVAVAATAWALPFKMWVDSGSATAVARKLIANSGSGELRGVVGRVCTDDPADLSSVSDVMTATSVCVFRDQGPRPTAEVALFKGSSVAAPDVPGDTVTQGILYSPQAQMPVVWDSCERHIQGHWWAYEELILECPSGYTPHGSG